MPRSATRVEVYEWNRQVEQSAQAIRNNQNLDQDLRRTALETLRQQTEAVLAAQLGQAAYDLYRRNGGHWLKRMIESP